MAQDEMGAEPAEDETEDHAQESSESTDDLVISRKLSTAQVDEFEHEIRREQEELDEIIRSESKVVEQVTKSEHTSEQIIQSSHEESTVKSSSFLMESKAFTSTIASSEHGTDTPKSTDERPLSPSSYTLETDTDIDENTHVEEIAMDMEEREEPEGRMSTDISQQIFIEQTIMSHSREETFQEEENVDDYHVNANMQEEAGINTQQVFVDDQVRGEVTVGQDHDDDMSSCDEEEDALNSLGVQTTGISTISIGIYTYHFPGSGHT
ncbi:uncharacterized protein [Argopecten irradians]|uniref:uncharacterized protein n=1 Tax=Argopecten irradians TaxID=31199 RepID=UPI003711E8D9